MHEHRARLAQKEHEADRWVAATAVWMGRPLVAHDGIFKDFSKLSDRPGAAVDLVERARTFNVAVILIAQAWSQPRA